MSKARHVALVEKSIDACIAAIEVYNKPDFHYREEAFSILMLNGNCYRKPELCKRALGNSGQLRLEAANKAGRVEDTTEVREEEPL